MSFVNAIKRKNMGVVLMLLASASFATMATMIKAIGNGIPMSQLVFLRSILALPILFGIIVYNSKPLVVRAKQILWWRSIFGIVAMHGFFFALTHMPLAECIFIGRSQPLLLALFAPFILGETASREAWIAIGTGLVGAALIMKPAMMWPLAAWVALGAAASAAMAQLLVRRLNRTDHPLAIVFYFLLITAIVTSTWVLPHFTAMTFKQWVLMSGVAVFASMGQLFMTFAYRLDKAPVVAAASYSSVVLSVFYGYIFWDEVPHPLAWLGGGLIVLGGVLLVKSRLQQQDAASK